METFKQLLIVLCTWQFILAPVAMAGDLTGDTALQAEREACTGSTVEWNSALNSCVTKQEVIDTKNQTESCSTTDDPESCYMNTAEEKTGVKKGQNGNDDTATMETVAKTVAGAYALFTLMSGAAVVDSKTGLSRESGSMSSSGFNEKKGGCLSKYIYQATTSAWIVGDFFLKKKAKKGFEKLAEEYKKEQGNEENKSGDDGSYQSQVRAFVFLKQEQEKVKEQAKYRKLLQMAVVAGFTASLVLGIKESIQHKAGKVVGYCKGKSKSGDVKTLGASLAKFGSSEQVSMGAGVMLGLNAYLIIHAMKEQKRAEDNIENIDDVIATYSEYVAGFCPDGREDLTNERCYCYNGDGTQNENRGSSVICQNLFASDGVNYSLLNEKPFSITEGPRQGCVTITGQFDEECKCRKMINGTTKQNACANSPGTTALNGGFAAQIGAPDTLKALNAFPQGANAALGSLNEASLQKSAARNKSLAESMIKKANQEGAKFPTLGALEDKAEKLALGASDSKSLANLNSAFSPGRASSLASNPSLAKAIEKAESRINLTPTLASSGSGKGSIGSGAKGGNGFKFNWNDAAAKEGNKVQTFMEKKYKYKGSDIVKRNDVSLWNVISRRYQTSGLKRLFGEDEDAE